MNSAMRIMNVTPKTLALVGLYTFCVAGALLNTPRLLLTVMLTLTILM